VSPCVNGLLEEVVCTQAGVQSSRS
jgi:hypothetical protein